MSANISLKLGPFKSFSISYELQNAVVHDFHFLPLKFQFEALVRRCYIFGTCSNPSMADPYFNRSSKSAVLAVCVPLSAARIVILSF